MKEFQRWYDSTPRVKELFSVFRKMTKEELERCSRVLYEVIVEHRKREQCRVELCSVGAEKLQGYYKAFKRRRWYDQNPHMMNSARFLSLMEPMEAEMVVCDFIGSLRINGISQIYEKNKFDL